MANVYFSETKDRRDFTIKVLDVFKESLEKAKKIFVKPNIVSYEGYPTTTHPDVLDAVLSRLVDSDVVVGDGPAVDAGSLGRFWRRRRLGKSVFLMGLVW
jgi:uncharacterized protein (DUF362 family)